MNTRASASAATPASRLRWGFWLVLLAVAAWLAFFGDKTPNPGPRAAAVVNAVAPATAARRPPARTEAVAEPVQALRPRAEPEALARPQADLFAVADWHRPPIPPPPPPGPALAPVEAPVPVPNYRVLGKKQENDTWEVFLGRDDLSFIAREGETLEGLWRVERIEPPSLHLVHLPSRQVRVVAIGEAR